MDTADSSEASGRSEERSIPAVVRHQSPEPLALLASHGLRLTTDGVVNDGREVRGDEEIQRRMCRVPFTEDDDRLIEDWVAAAERQGVSTAGTRVFRDLALVVGAFLLSRPPHGVSNADVSVKDDRHTMLSWQARWTRSLRRRARSLPTPASSPSVSSHAASTAAETPSDRHASPTLDPPAEPFIPDTDLASSSVWRPEDRAVPPPHFRALDHNGPLGRDSRTQHRANSELTLRQALNVQDTEELACWLTQDWVIDVYAEYAGAVLDNPPARFEHAGRETRRSSSRYVINNAMEALRSGRPRYTGDNANKAGWGIDDHDIRFVVRLVQRGRLPGRCWAALSSGDAHLSEMCTTAHRLANWLRYVHTDCETTGSTARWHRRNCSRWRAILAEARSRRFPMRTTLQHDPPVEGAPNPVLDCDDSETECGSPRPVRAPSAGSVSSHTGSAAGEHALEPHRVLGPAPITASRPMVPPPPLSRLPLLPSYPTGEFPDGGHDDKYTVWAGERGSDVLRRRQRELLASWGVSPTQKGACVLVPAMWASSDPLHLATIFTPKDCPSKGAQRMLFMLAGHCTTFMRASTWFAQARRGIDLDNFFGHGPFIPMEGSHLCHQPHCINPNHGVYEPSTTNKGRNRCYYFACDLRMYGFDVPEACIRHDPPCLLSLAAITTAEAYCLQFVNLGRAKGLSPTTFTPPGGHPFPTFEQRLPLSFSTASRALDLRDLVGNSRLPPGSEQPTGPRFYCRFCIVRTFKSVVAYWYHIRDGHGETSDEDRLAEIGRSGEVWRAHLEDRRARGHATSKAHPTWCKLEQIGQPNFNWEVVKTWKLRYFTER